jgi:DNA-binding LacI/PurR family transcriptional regulator
MALELERAGDARPPTMADVAARAGVSHQTVSRVLNQHPPVKETTRARVLVAIEELGYRRKQPARAFTNRGHIGMIAAHLALYGPSMVAASVQEAGHAAGYGVALVGLPELTDESLHNAVDRLLDQAVEALVVAVAHPDAIDAVGALELPIPVVLTQGVMPGQAMAAGIDQQRGGERATHHLLDATGHGVAHVTGPLDWVEARQRREGWRRAHEARGITPGPEVAGDWSAGSGYQAALTLFDDPSVDAVFAANDATALGVLRALHERGRDVPGEVRVVGFDDVPEAGHYWPPLSTVRQDFGALGQRAVDLTLRALGGEPGAVAELVEPVLVVRRSSGA